MRNEMQESVLLDVYLHQKREHIRRYYIKYEVTERSVTLRALASRSTLISTTRDY
jgi:hypothetical protein